MTLVRLRMQVRSLVLKATKDRKVRKASQALLGLKAMSVRLVQQALKVSKVL
jgi:hypothetical protein